MQDNIVFIIGRGRQDLCQGTELVAKFALLQLRLH